MIKLGQMVLKGVNWLHNDKIRSNGLERVNWVHNDKIRSNGVERSELGTIQSGHMVLKGSGAKTRFNGLERRQ